MSDDVPNTQWTYLIFNEGYGIEGTNDLKVATEAVKNGDTVLEVATSKELRWNGMELDAVNVPEQRTYKFD